MFWYFIEVDVFFEFLFLFFWFFWRRGGRGEIPAEGFGIFFFFDGRGR